MKIKHAERIVLVAETAVLIAETAALAGFPAASAAPRAAAPAAARPAATAPAWLHIRHTDHRHHGAPCVFVWGGSGDTSALVCRDGYAETS